MNNFFAEYLENIVPAPFNLRSENRLIKIGEGAPRFTVTINNAPKSKDLLASTSLALGEAYMRGDIQVDGDLYKVLDILLGGIKNFSADKNALSKIIHTSKSRKNQKNEVQSHYDIGNDFYSLWLDETMNYSCAYFKSSRNSLYEAQINKAEHILNKLRLKKGMSLLDIGCGWGFLLKYAVKNYGVSGVGITLSEEQYKKFGEDIKNEGLSEVLRVELMDYRELEHCNMRFDRAVSVGMLEHVGRGNYGLFLKNISAVLKPEGLFLLHFISSLKESDGDGWIKKYIFPGGVIPSLREIIYSLADYGFYTLDVESLRRHYNLTLLCWLENFRSHKNEITEKMGLQFTRMWELYLASCAAAFDNGIVDLHQILMSKGANNSLPIIRTV